VRLVRGCECSVLAGIQPNVAWLGHEICREERVDKSVPAQDDPVASGELVDAVKYLIPGVLRHEADERVQTDHRLLTQMVENGCRECIHFLALSAQRMDVKI